ncbi:DNA repair exonuclease SbcCD ATPase subunit [Pseudobutyrivibrio sp. C4]|uniref:AAA family ATPase n=1 Tax=Pseudobutyrivibrio sp. C4 TaxID=1520803 RepID=UPI0008B22380|nr:AAA family ATPase [Pseudobutyrivibrio sp. C4]SES77944.1 DNA repair exonuclease SbcCD ATPase subunit [Pseudobutyrivibrio sp. C4]
MKIKRIVIENFRGIHEKREFYIGEGKFVLLSAANGWGKTTILDAIEWCLTGSIGRLNESLMTRATNGDERKKNIDGILKNKYAGNQDYVIVELQIIDKAEIHTIIRKQQKDTLLPDGKSTVIVDGIANKNGDWLSNNINNSFYNYHFCDIQKTIGIQNKKRENLSSLFEDFIRDFSKEKKVADNMELFVSDIKKIISETEAKRDKLLITITNNNEKLQELQKDLTNKEYPHVLSYGSEKIEIKSLNIEELEEQKNKIAGCAYSEINKLLDCLQKNNKNIDILNKLELVNAFNTDNKETILQANKYGLLADEGEMVLVEQAGIIKSKKEIKIDRDNILNLGEQIANYRQGIFSRALWEDAKENIIRLKAEIAGLNDDIKNITEGNDLLKQLSKMVEGKEILLQYRDKQVHDGKIVLCPVCGSNTFNNLPSEKILQQAESYIIANNGIVLEKTRELSNKENELGNLYTQLIEKAQLALNVSIDDDIHRMAIMKDLDKKIYNYREWIDRLKDYYKIDNTEVWGNQQFIENKINDIGTQVMSNEDVTKFSDDIKDLLSLVNYNSDSHDDYNSIKVKIKPYILDDYIDTSKNVLVDKMVILSQMLNSDKYKKVNADLEAERKECNEAEEKIKSLNNLKELAINKQNDIRTTITNLEIDEYKNVGPTLFELYSKLSLVKNIKEINIRRDEEESQKSCIIMEDEKKNSIVNVLSNGQLSVFMLACFFSIIMTRKDKEPFKVYFLDDLSSFMDDVNMLAFLDMIKYQLEESDDSIEQLFFATCDEKICKLVKYKLNGASIIYDEIDEQRFIDSKISG